MKITNEIYYHIMSDQKYEVGNKFLVGNKNNKFADEIFEMNFILNDQDANQRLIEMKQKQLLIMNQENFDLVFSAVNNYAMITRELVFESVRKENYCDLPSRLRGLYVVKTLDEIDQWLVILKRTNKKPFQILKLKLTGKIFCGNGNLILRQNNSLNAKIKQANLYWSSQEANGVNEYIFEGEVEVIDIVKEF